MPLRRKRGFLWGGQFIYEPSQLFAPWPSPYYAPQRPAQYFVEGHPNILDKVQIGDRLELEQ
jgi:hypothetical protein